MWNNKRTFIITLSVILLAGLALSGMVVYPRVKQRWQAPLGPALELPTYTASAVLPSDTPAATALAAAAQPGTLQLPTQTIAPATATTAPTATPQPLCGGPPLMTVLAVGADNRDNTYLYGLGAAGERGVDHALTILGEGVTRTMALVGASTVADLTPELLRPQS